MINTVQDRMSSAIISAIEGGESGGTFDTFNHPLPLSGYWVGGVVPSYVTSEPIEDDVDRFVKANTHRYFGFWWDGTSLYLDVSEHHTDKETALSTARERGELAVWDIARQVEIFV